MIIEIKKLKKIKEKLAVLSEFPDLPFAEDLTGKDYIEIHHVQPDQADHHTGDFVPGQRLTVQHVPNG